MELQNVIRKVWWGFGLDSGLRRSGFFRGANFQRKRCGKKILMVTNEKYGFDGNPFAPVDNMIFLKIFFFLIFLDSILTIGVKMFREVTGCEHRTLESGATELPLVHYFLLSRSCRFV